MATTCSQILSEARALVSKLHDREKSCSTMIGQTTQLSERIKCMSEYKEDLEALNNLNPKPRSALVHSLQQENRQIRLLQEENRQLKLTLEEHQAALELIMRKYRQQMIKSKNLEAIQSAAQTALNNIRTTQASEERDVDMQLNFMAKFEACLRIGEEASHKDHEEIARLQSENKLLRQLVAIASTNDPNATLVYSEIVKEHKLDVQLVGKFFDDKCLEEQTTPKADLSPEDRPSCSESTTLESSTFAQASATVTPPVDSAAKHKKAAVDKKSSKEKVDSLSSTKRNVDKTSTKLNGNNNELSKNTNGNSPNSTMKKPPVKRVNSKENSAEKVGKKSTTPPSKLSEDKKKPQILDNLTKANTATSGKASPASKVVDKNSPKVNGVK